MTTRPLTPLTRPLTRAITAAGAGGGAFDPASLWLGSEVGFAFDFSDPATLFQDSARTTPVSSLGDPIGSATDISPNSNHASQATPANRPLFQGYADFDGTNDRLDTPSINFSGTAKATVVIGLRRDTSGVQFVFNQAFASITPSLWCDDGVDNYNFGFGGGTLRATPFAAPIQNVITMALDVDPATIQDELKPRIDGAAPSLTVHVAGPAGAFPNPIGTGAYTLGIRSDGSFPLNGRIYRMIVIGRTLTASEVLAAEAWCGEPFI